MNTYTVSRSAFSWEVLCLAVPVCRCSSKGTADEIAMALNRAATVPTLLDALRVARTSYHLQQGVGDKINDAIALAERFRL